MGMDSMKMRGRMQEGMMADITVFDPEAATDNATYKQGTLPTTGISCVIVNAVMVVKESKVLEDVNPRSARPLRAGRDNATLSGWR
jgi:N-acyl-D-aspartate/D-glutamate deacylase